MSPLPPLTQRIDQGAPGGHEFERLMHQLLLQYAKEKDFSYEPVSGLGGDRGVDGWAKSGVPELTRGPVAFQFKWLWGDIHQGPKAAQIQESLERVSRLHQEPRHWVLVTPRDLTRSEREWLSGLSTSKLMVHHWGQAKVENLLRGLPSLFARYYPQEAGLLTEESRGLDFGQLAATYRERVAQGYRHLRTLGLPPETLRERDTRAEIPLRDLFVPLRFMTEDGRHDIGSLAHLLSGRKSIVVLGDPGAGKSTLLAFISLLLAGEAQLERFTLTSRVVPILVSLRQFVRERSEYGGLPILDYLVRHARSDLSLLNAHPYFFDATLRMGEAVILFDGLDEVGNSAAKYRISGMISSFQAEYPQCPVWVTSRIYGYTPDVRLPESIFQHVRIGRLDDFQVEDFIRRWYALQYPHNERERIEFTDSLHKAVQKTPSVRRLAGNPLLLTLMAFIHHGTRRLPQARGELYSKCTEMLLKTWQDAKREVEQEASHPFSRRRLPIQTQQDYLAHLALRVQERNQEGKDDNSRGLISRQDAIECLTDRHLTLARRERPGLTPGEARAEMKDFLDYISDQTGLLIDRGNDQLSFIHLSFQEYLAAWVFTCQPELHDNSKFFIKYLGHPAWEETLLLRLYIIRFDQGGVSAFDAIVSEVLRHLETKGVMSGWLMLARALRDNLDFMSDFRDKILKKVIDAWVDSPQQGDTWFSALEEIKLFSEKPRARLMELLDEICRQEEETVRAIAALHLRTRLFGFSPEATVWLEKHKNFGEILPDLVAFLGEPGIAVFLAERATLSDWEIAFSALDGRALYLASLEWVLGDSSCKPGEQALRAAAAVLRRKTIMDLQSRGSFAKRHRQSDASGLLVRPGRVQLANRFYEVEFPISGVQAGSVYPKYRSKPPRSLLSPVLAEAQFGQILHEIPAVMTGMQDWVEQFLRALLHRFSTTSIPLSGIPELFVRSLVHDFVRAFDRAFVRSVGSDYGRAFIRDFGSNFGRAFVRDFGSNFGSNFGRDFGRDFGRAFVRDFVSDCGRDFVRALGSVFGSTFGSDFGRDFIRTFGRDYVRDLGLDPEFEDWEQQWTQFASLWVDLLRLFLDERVWNYFFFFPYSYTEIYLESSREGLAVNIENPLALPFLFIAALVGISDNHLFSLGRHVAMEIHHNDERWEDAVFQWLSVNPLDLYIVSLSWESHARAYSVQHKRLAGDKGVLMLAHAAYARLMTGLPLSGPVWTQLVAERDREDPHIQTGYLLHEICHFRNVEQNVQAWNVLMKKRPSEDQTPALQATSPAAPARKRATRKRTTQASSSASATAQEPTIESVPEPLFAWIHLSDIHIGHGGAGHGWDQKLVLSVLKKDIADEQKRGQLPRPDALLVTGDIAFSGEAKQYTEAQQWLLEVAKAVGLDQRRVFTVPGNHDVQRAADKDSNIKRLMRGLREGADDLDEVLNNETDRTLLAKRMENYLAFSAQLAPGCLPEATTSLASWIHRLVARGGLRVRLVGLNTALLSADDKDHGKLRLGKGALGQALSSLPEDDELVLVLSHHPLRAGWLTDQREADSWLRTHSHVHLSGHVHEADLEELRAGSGNTLLRIAAGAVHGERTPPGVPAGHGYSLAAAYPRSAGGLLIRVWPRLWSDKNKDFRPDLHNLPKGREYAEHTIEGIRLATQKAKPSP